MFQLRPFNDGGDVSTELGADLRRRQYRNPPVVEGVARLAWASEWLWNIATPGLLFERLKDLYPDEPRQQANVQANVQANKGDPDTTLHVETGPPKFIFSRGDNSRLLSLSPADISAHGLQPYEGWESLEARLFEGIDRLSEIAPAPMFRQVGLRYINQVVIPEASIEFEDYLTVTLQKPMGFPEDVTGFLERTEMMYPGGSSRIALTWASVTADPGTVAFMVDLDLFHTSETPLELSQAREQLADLKEKEGYAFEGLLKDKLREIFDEVRS